MEKGVSYLITAFVMLIIGIALLSVYADQSTTSTTLVSTTETLSLANARLAGGAINDTYYYYPTYLGYSGTWRGDDSSCSVSSLVVKNSTGGILDDPSQYVFVTDARLNFENAVGVNYSTSNTTTITYSYCPDGYVASAWGRSIIGVTVGLLAVLLLAGTVGFVYLAIKEFR
jgi:hypothetical protein